MVLQLNGKALTGPRRAAIAARGPLVCYLLGVGSPSVKQKIMETVEHLPDDATVEDAMERLYFLAKIERGLEQSEAGLGLSHEDVKKRFLRNAL
jgi:hypothetical protein